EAAIRASWSLDTAEEDDGWTPDNPSRGQCDVTSLVVHDLFGGDVLAADVFRDGERVEAHMWNRLPGGLEVDLTREQFKNAEGIERVTRINSLKVRFLGDKVLQQTAWRVADQLGWETTFDAEFVALTQLQADAFITFDSDLARAVSGLVETATIDALRKA